MAILAHDMRNPLSALLTNIHFVQSVARGSTLDVDEALADSALSCTILSQVIGNLEVLGRAFGPTNLSPTPLGTREAAGHAVARASAQASLSGIEIVILPGSGATVHVEPVFFGRALDNILANALQYSPARGKVTIELATEGARSGVWVSDSGPIVPPDFRERVPFGTAFRAVLVGPTVSPRLRSDVPQKGNRFKIQTDQWGGSK